MREKLVFALAVLAADTFASDADLFSLSLAELQNVRVSSSTLHEETLLEVPSSITVFGRNEIAALGISTIAELLNLVPGYQSYRGDNGNESYFVSARAGRRGANSKGVLFLVNGARYNTNQNGGAFDGQNFPLDGVERVEVIRGPGSAIYGSNAFLGVINIVTRTDNSVKASIGNNDEKRITLQTSNTIGDHALETNLWVRRRGGEKQLAYDAESDDLIEITDKFESSGAHLVYRHAGWENQTYFIREVDEEGYVTGLPAKSPEDNFVSDNFFTELKNQTEFGDAWDLTSSLSYHLTKVTPEVTSSLNPPLALKVNARSSEFVFSSVAQFERNRADQWLFGLEYRNSETHKANLSTTGVVNSSTTVEKDGAQDIFGAFVQNQHRFSNKVRSIIGVRYDHYPSFGGQFSPRTGLTYALNDSHTLKALYGEAYRAPVRSETNQVNNPVFVANDQLKPEVSKTTELVWAYVENDHYVQTSFFYTELIDLIQSTNTSPQTLFNSGVEKSSGIESEWVATIDSSWNLRSSATYFFDRPEGKQSSESEFLFSSSVTYTSSTYLVSFLMNHQSSKVDENSSLKGATTHGSFTTFDIFAKYFVKDDLEVFAKVKNMFDKDYLTPGFISSNTYGIQGFSRQLEVGINLSFGG